MTHPSPTRRGSVFWRVAGVLFAALLVTGLGGVVMSAYLWETRSGELIRNSLALRLDGLADEIESRATFEPVGEGLSSALVVDEELRYELSTRFPDPITVVGPDGLPVLDDEYIAMPESVVERLAVGRIAVELDERPPWALVPLFDLDGMPAGGLVVYPLERALERELAAARDATRSALWIIVLVAIGIAILLGGLLTASLVAPLRRMTSRVEAIGAGRFDERLAVSGNDEFGRLASTINEMATRVENSFDVLRQSDTMRRELVANIGHDLRTPLASVEGYLEEAQRFLAEGRIEDARSALATSRSQARHIERLVDDLFELSLLDPTRDAGKGQPVLRLEPVPLSELLNDVADAYRIRMESERVTFVVDVPPDLPSLEADGARLHRLFANLIDNALRHTPPGEEIVLVATREQERIVVTVSDTGEGIDPDSLEYIFDRYYRGTSSRTRVHSGSGLGLAIARAIAEAHGGSITAVSKVGEGSTFTVYLPYEGRSEGRFDDE